MPHCSLIPLLPFPFPCSTGCSLIPLLPPQCRLFLKKLKTTLKIPVLALVDSDPYGLKILSVYMKVRSREEGKDTDTPGLDPGSEGALWGSLTLRYGILGPKAFQILHHGTLRTDSGALGLGLLSPASSR